MVVSTLSEQQNFRQETEDLLHYLGAMAVSRAGQLVKEEDKERVIQWARKAVRFTTDPYSFDGVETALQLPYNYNMLFQLVRQLSELVKDF
jgi:hypothetical protein